jgi:ribosomal 50S subunit-recycling heat shock protein
MSSENSMRLDRFLKLSRLVPRRSAAKELCDSGSVRVNGQPAKAGREVHQGDRIELRLPAREFTIEVLGLPSGRSVPKAAARELYRVVEERRFDLLGNELPPR